MASVKEGKDPRGYFATLGITFRAEEDEINRKYKKLALKMHPDKNKAEDAVDVFQAITTSCAHRPPPPSRARLSQSRALPLQRLASRVQTTLRRPHPL